MLNLADALQGKRIRCPECGSALAVPSADQQAAPRSGTPSEGPHQVTNPRTARKLTRPLQSAKRGTPDKPARKASVRRAEAVTKDYEEVNRDDWLDDDYTDVWNDPPMETASLPGRSSRPNRSAKPSRKSSSRSKAGSGLSTIARTLLIAVIAFTVPIVIGVSYAVLKSLMGGATASGIPDVAGVQVSPSIFPERPDFQPAFASGIQLARTRLIGSGPAEKTQMNIYLPAGQHSDRSLGCVLVAPAGTNLLIGNSMDGDDYHDETLPYAEAGFVAIQYSLDGPVRDMETASDGEFSAAYKLFKAAGAGTLNTKCVIEFVKARLPEVDPSRIYTAGHSSAGTVSLLAAEYHSEVCACIAYAPCSDTEAFHADISSARGVNLLLPGISEFDRQFSPLVNAARLKCPLFVFQARDDSVVEVQETKRFVDRVRQTNAQVEYVEVAFGEHYDSMIEQGIPRAVQWLKAIDVSKAGK